MTRVKRAYPEQVYIRYRKLTTGESRGVSYARTRVREARTRVDSVAPLSYTCVRKIEMKKKDEWKRQGEKERSNISLSLSSGFTYRDEGC